MAHSIRRFALTVLFALLAGLVAHGAPGIHGNIHRIEYNGNVAYLFGSMHLGRPGWFPLSDAAESAMRRADVFAFEFDLTRMEETALLSLGYALLPGGQTLAAFLPLEVYEVFVANMSTYSGFHYWAMNRFTPMFLSIGIALPELFAEMGIYMEYSVDSYILDFAMKRGADIIGLNDLQSEMSAALGLPDDVQIAVAESTLDRAASIEAARELQMVEMYEAQDLAGLLQLRRALGEAEDAFSAHMLTYMIHARCCIFAAEIARLLRQTQAPTTFFITMWILHILGGDQDTNVLGLLREKGFEVVPVF